MNYPEKLLLLHQPLLKRLGVQSLQLTNASSRKGRHSPKRVGERVEYPHARTYIDENTQRILSSYTVYIFHFAVSRAILERYAVSSKNQCSNHPGSRD